MRFNLLDVEVVLDTVLEDAEVGDNAEEEHDTERQHRQVKHFARTGDLGRKGQRNERR